MCQITISCKNEPQEVHGSSRQAEEGGHTVNLKIRTEALPVLTAVAVAFMVACMGEQAPVQLGPVDGFELAPTEINRVRVGTEAPSFSLTTMNDDTLTLSDYRGQKDVVLVFYRGHW